MTQTRYETIACNSCGECRLVFINPRPAAKELATIYIEGDY